jgi:hypothetical protein
VSASSLPELSEAAVMTFTAGPYSENKKMFGGITEPAVMTISLSVCVSNRQ